MSNRDENGFDIRVSNHGSIFLVHPVSERGRNWVDDHLDHAQKLGNAAAVEHRYIEPIVNGILEDCLWIEGLRS